VQMVSCCQRRGVRVLCSGSYHFLLCHLYSTRSPQFLPHGLAYFPSRLCKHLLTHTSSLMTPWSFHCGLCNRSRSWHPKH
jgi:hypothetical protein